MVWNVRLFLLLIPYAFWSESSYPSYGVKELGLLFFLSGSRVTNPLTYRIDGFKPQFSSYYLLYVHSWSPNLIIVLLSGYATILLDVSNHFEHLQTLCCPSHPRFLNSRMHLQIPSSCFRCAFGQINHTNQWVEVLYCLDIYVGVIIMTLGVLGDHLVI